MRHQILLPLCLTISFAALSSSCERVTSETKPASGKPTIFVPVAPYAFLAEAIGGDSFVVETLVSENDDPHSYAPTPKDVVRLSSSQLYFTAEMPFEEVLLEKLGESQYSPQIINLLDGLDTVDGSCDHEDHDHDAHDHDAHDHDAHDHEEHDHEEHDHEEHDHEEHDHEEHDHEEHDHEEHDHEEHDHEEHAHEDNSHDGHDHSGLDPHVWLSPAHLIEQVNIVSSALRGMVDSPEEKEEIDERTLQLIFDITTTDKELVNALASRRGETFYVYHGAFGYFANAYGLIQKSVELNGRSPEPRELVTLIEQAKKDKVSVIFVQPQFDTSSATALAEAIGGKVVPIDPLAKDVLNNLLNIADTISGE